MLWPSRLPRTTAPQWRGNGVTILHRVPYSAVNFWAYEWLTHAFLEARARAPGSPGEGKGRHGAGVLVAEDFSRRLAIGALSGGAACAAAYPLDLARTRLSVQLATGRQPPRMGALLMGVVRSEGVRGLYRGLGEDCYRRACFLLLPAPSAADARCYLSPQRPRWRRPGPRLPSTMPCTRASVIGTCIVTGTSARSPRPP